MTKRGDFALYRLVPAFALLVVLACLSTTAQALEPVEEARAAAPRPNVLLILSDDQEPQYLDEMPKVQRELVSQGANFTNAYTADPQCCPSRASLFTGKYVHNHDVKDNSAPNGGFEAFDDRSTIATWLDRAGYRTGLAGKYMNQYSKDRRYIPPGWDTWFAVASQGEASQRAGQALNVNENGKLKSLKVRETEYLTSKSRQFIRNKKKGEPWFLAVTSRVPHSPFTPSKKHLGSYNGREMPRSPSFNEEDISDKPGPIRNQPLLTEEQITGLEQQWRRKMEEQRDLDDMVGKLVSELQSTGQLRNTYIIYSSDNGFMMGEHRSRGKGKPYEASSSVPFVVRGPGVVKGERNEIVSLIDVAPTIATWGKVSPPNNTDGRSMKTLLQSRDTAWRSRLLVEYEDKNPDLTSRPFKMLVSQNGDRYIRYINGTTEYYDLNEDPFQLENSISPEVDREFSGRLKSLVRCSGPSCRKADGPLIR